jgi:hypothetical protein
MLYLYHIRRRHRSGLVAAPVPRKSTAAAIAALFSAALFSVSRGAESL